MKMIKAAAIYLLLLTTWISAEQQTCINLEVATEIELFELQLCPPPSFFATPPPTSFVISYPFIPLDVLIRRLPNPDSAAQQDLWELILFVGGASAENYLSLFESNVVPESIVDPVIPAPKEYFENCSIYDAPAISNTKESIPAASEVKEKAVPVIAAREDKEFQSYPPPSIFATQQPSAFPISLPLLTLEEIIQHLPNPDSGAHPFEDLREPISFVDGSTVNFAAEDFYSLFESNVAPVISKVEKYFENCSIYDAPVISDIKESIPSVFEVKDSVATMIADVEDKVFQLFTSPSIFASQQPSTFPISLPLLTLDEIIRDLPNADYGAHSFEDLREPISFIGESAKFAAEEFYSLFESNVAPIISAAEEYVDNCSVDDAPVISNMKESIPRASEVKARINPIVDAVEDKATELSFVIAIVMFCIACMRPSAEYL